MAKKDNTKDILEKSISFYDKYLTFNKYAVSKHDPKLNKLIDSSVLTYENILTLEKGLTNNGSRVWNHNNICLDFPSIPKNVLKLLEPKYGNENFIKSMSENTFTYEGELNDPIYNIDELHEFLKYFLNCDLEFSELKNQYRYINNNNDFKTSFHLLSDRYYDHELHSSNNAFINYGREVRKEIAKSQSVVIENYSTIAVRDVLRDMFYGGVNVYDNFNMLSIDPPTTSNLGFSIINYCNGKFKIVDSGTFKIPNYFKREKTIFEIHKFVSNIIFDYSCKCIVSESAMGFGIQKIRTLLNENVGIFRYIAEQYSVPFLTISPKHFKMNVLGDYKADKETTIKWVSKFVHKNGKYIEEHEADAICIGISFLVDRELINVPE